VTRFLLLLVSLIAAPVVLATSPVYDFPFKDPLVATVLGTPKDLRAEIDYDIPREDREIVIFPDRKIPSIVALPKYRYSITAQDQAAPLIFVIAGTGSSHRGAKMKLLEAAFYGAGFHVVSLSSPTYANFIITASSTRIPGRTSDDAGDLYRVMEMIWAEHKDRLEVTGFHVTGYSLGGANAAFVARLDEQRQVFNFKKVLMINPPVNLFNSVDILDRMLDDNIPGPVAPDFDTFLERVMRRFAEVYASKHELDFNDEFLYQIYQADLEEGRKVRPETLQALIGASFRISSANMVTTADYAAQRGFIIPKNHRFGISESTTPYFKVAARTTFADYIEELYLPYFREKIPGSTRDELIAESSLKSIESYLRNTDKIGVMHNADDIILAEGEMAYLRQVFGSRLKTYPDGGHCGNMAHRDNVAFMVDYFKD
jgi:pimeloyl-ACP methyl ester carboxylesterase